MVYRPHLVDLKYRSDTLSKKILCSSVSRMYVVVFIYHNVIRYHPELSPLTFRLFVGEPLLCLLWPLAGLTCWFKLISSLEELILLCCIWKELLLPLKCLTWCFVSVTAILIMIPLLLGCTFILGSHYIHLCTEMLKQVILSMSWSWSLTCGHMNVWTSVLFLGFSQLCNII